MKVGNMKKLELVLVSVPYRGATLLNFPVPQTLQKFLSSVSVPYRGATLLNALESSSRHTIEFPSPIGELLFLII